jgi:hypothetical protein
MKELPAPIANTMAKTVEVKMRVSFQYLMKAITKAAIKVCMHYISKALVLERRLTYRHGVQSETEFLADAVLNEIGICRDSSGNLSGTKLVKVRYILPEHSLEVSLSNLLCAMFSNVDEPKCSGIGRNESSYKNISKIQWHESMLALTNCKVHKVKDQV